MFRLNQVVFSADGRTISYDYEVGREITKYFNKKESFFASYDAIIGGVPESLAVIPLLANVMPIAWFVGFDVLVPEVDETFFHALTELKSEFSKHFPNIKESSLRYDRLVRNAIGGDKSALLFSGGLDSFESLTRNLSADPYLVSVLGADIEINDARRWEDFKRFNTEEPIVNNEKLYYVTSNLRTFYTYEVDLLVEVNWWGKVQHGMALIGLIAPLSHICRIRTIMIASSNTGEVSFGWGSTSETDEKVKWANCNVIHDGFHLRRTDKIHNIVDFANRTGEHIKLRVCYSDLRTGYNCSRCTKCQRTMLGLMLCGANPNDFGFDVPTDFHELVMKNFGADALMTDGVAYEWRCLQDEAKTALETDRIADPKNNIATFAGLPLDRIINRNADKLLARKKMKYRVINRFPGLFSWYLSLKRKFQ